MKETIPAHKIKSDRDQCFKGGQKPEIHVISLVTKIASIT